MAKQKKFGAIRIMWIVVLCVLFVATLAFIWGNSMLDSTTSTKESGAVYDIMQPVFDSVFGAGAITEDITRKIAHGAEFFVLGLELTLIFAAFGNYSPKNWAFIMSEGIFVALVDETIQYFTERGPAVIDVWIDVGGFFAISLIAGCIGLIVHAVRNKKAAKQNQLS